MNLLDALGFKTWEKLGGSPLCCSPSISSPLRWEVIPCALRFRVAVWCCGQWTTPGGNFGASAHWAPLSLSHSVRHGESPSEGGAPVRAVSAPWCALNSVRTLCCWAHNIAQPSLTAEDLFPSAWLESRRLISVSKLWIKAVSSPTGSTSVDDWAPWS